MGDLFRLSDDQLRRLEPFFPKSRGRVRVDDRRVLSGIIFVNRNGLRWRDAPAVHGPPKTLYNRWVRWSRMEVWARALAALVAEDQDVETVETVMIDATHLKAHRTAAGLRGQKRTPAAGGDASSAAPRAG
jgi:transposase